MKTIVLICVLLASLLFSSPSFIVARELLATPRDGSTVGTGKPNKPKVSCGDHPGDPYGRCIGSTPKPPHKCQPKGVYGGRACKPPQGP
ncbi:hypothetical protein I3843_03G018500 [Carya illinoinensis]|uniref:Uncharacterized protein n=1 Tax=Carya illinoinensis TaxID=32201 RepID=A0A8T1QZD9_CARIL|nr:hypothetical protein CIPAW_03G022000 [Carya illinoinensis]KAG6719649.1 hypothetical protein I3842_03G016600 [Carya illinoinensis]KAG7985303.1 hypothetical protein I3843_03G018500 [Carya illinoinensis]